MPTIKIQISNNVCTLLNKGEGHMSETNKPADQTANAGGVDLTVQDLNVLRTVIDVATQRGAFKANELAAVGQTYNKLDTFLSTIQKQQEEAAKQSDATPTTNSPVSGADAASALSGEPTE